MTKTKTLVFLVLSILFLLVGLVASYYLGQPASEKKLAAGVATALQHELLRFDKEADTLISQAGSPAWQQVDDSFFLVDSLKVLDWTSNDFLPDLRTMQDTFSIRLLQAAQGDYLVKKWAVSEDVFLLAVIPLRKDFKIVNNYLAPTWNQAIFKTPLRIVDPAGFGESVCLRDGNCLFKIRTPRDASADGPYAAIGLSAICLSIVSFLLFVYVLTRSWYAKQRYFAAFAGVAVALITLRIIMVKFNFPNVFVDFVLFDPHRFASSSFNASMGDLLLNSLSILVLCLFIFLNYPHLGAKKLIALRASYRLWVGIGCLCVCFLALLYPYLFVEIIYHNSAVTLEITDTIAYDITRSIAFVSLLIGCISTFLIIHVFFRIGVLLLKERSRDFWIVWSVAALAFLGFILLNDKSYWITLAVGALYFALLYVARLVQSFRRFTFRMFLYFLVAIIALASQGALGFRKFDEERRVHDQFRFGEKFLVDQDVLGEFLLNESAQQIGKDPYIQATLQSPFLSRNSIRQKVRQFHLNEYFDRYDIEVLLFDVSGEPFQPQSATNFASLIRNFQGETYKTAYQGIYFINTPTSEATKQYLVIIPIAPRKKPAGFVVLNLKLKKVIPHNVYPELLVDNRFNDYFKSKDFSYAFYSQGKLANSFGEYNYEKNFNEEMLHDSLLYNFGVGDGDHYHIGIEDRNGQSAVVTAKNYPAFSVITNFSFLFVLGLVVVLIVLIVNGMMTWLTGARLDYAARIQLYVSLAFFLPLVTVSITTLSLTNRTAEEQLRKEYNERSSTLGERMAKPLQEFRRDPANYRRQNQIVELAKLTDLDASVYGVDGVLIGSSQPLIFQDHLTSTLINRKAWNAIVRDRENSFITTERIGKLRYNCSYVSIKSAESGEELGILSIPFFGSAQSLEKIQINVLSNILTVFVLVFILFSIVSFLISNGLTFPLRFIARSIKKTTLTDKNPLILWNSNDEIGLIANEYNRMIRNLEQSRVELARVQKETAWREIAKQVAHEIKNPLTPMKLTLQQLEQALNRNESTPERSRKAVETLLAQLEILNDIATSFSTFARMPAPVLEEVDLVALLKNIVGLHQNYSEGIVTLKLEAPAIHVLGDSPLLGRVFGNIILNALQAANGEKKVTVRVNAVIQVGKCLVRFQDDGRGIEKEIQEKVFLPHFSTKKTGSGLGLAIARQGIEQMGGRIWFETEEGKGTTFFVELELVQ